MNIFYKTHFQNTTEYQLYRYNNCIRWHLSVNICYAAKIQNIPIKLVILTLPMYNKR